MNLILVHGLGQSAEAWYRVVDRFPEGMTTDCPELSELTNTGGYGELYAAFREYCEDFPKPLDLCGLSLGAVLALNYAADFPENVRSLILIAGQYKPPRALMKLQGLIFRLMPEMYFEETGFGKANFIRLNDSMAGLNLSDKLKNVTADVLVVVGERDKPNARAARELSALLNCPMKIIPGSGHEVNLNAPKALAEIILEFYGQ